MKLFEFVLSNQLNQNKEILAAAKKAARKDLHHKQLQSIKKTIKQNQTDNEKE